MDINTLATKNGCIYVVRQLAAQLPDQAGIQALTPIASPSTATAEDVAEAVNAIIAALKDVA